MQLSTREALQQVLQARHDHLMTGNREAMNELLSPNFSFIDGLGRQFDAETYLDHYVDIDLIKWVSSIDESTVVELFETTALVQTLTEDQFQYGTTSYLGRFRVVSLYQLTEQGWKWHFSQSTSLDQDGR
ncbi:nuclear transport factor 2 family protein [Exiguobacterium sp. s193]|uniref:nuclear transport factor 2 family protein n=1 Tax=Exiguobacterium sp. s193 TaxID=2751207 RepID=UPI001BE5B8A6|nr:nuclear transport factor 2 family protein [Exiguobacterium sp. s193]